MSVKALAVTALFSASLVVGGCRSDDQRTLDDPLARDMPTADSTRTTPSDTGLVEARVTGEIAQVDPEAGTFTVTSAGMAHHFLFTDETEVIGASGAQGLASNEGDWVTVYFHDLPEGRKALRIELDAR